MVFDCIGMNLFINLGWFVGKIILVVIGILMIVVLFFVIVLMFINDFFSYVF